MCSERFYFPAAARAIFPSSEKGLPYQEFFDRIVGQEQTELRKIFQSLRAETGLATYNFKYRLSEQELITWYMEVYSELNELGEISMLKGTLYDTTEIVAMQSRLGELQELLEMKDQSLAMIAHDLRNPISQVDGVLRLLKEELHEPAQVELLSMAFDALKNTYNILGDLNDATRNKIIGSSISKQEIHVSTFLQGIADSFSFKLSEKQLSLELSVNLHSVLHANELKLMRAIENLISNAIKFSPPSKQIFLSAWEEKDSICIAVADQGIGMPEDIRKQLFQGMNKSIRRDGTEGERSIGIGLSIVKGVVDIHHGRIRVDSAEGEGSKFTLCLPKPRLS